ncbi:hypothetical protein BSR28_01670 [Boudabousia liubingyangii]|uniref:DUF5692 family protein n=1 Tax=Boudabousia liubingyangii TaxID=1921764 RepID=UPI000939DCBF|nr:DUF5692 family protein [Boudabousia liubingyangii]OKL48436.1 hypothetical protein BSR28_01670 [Boudabousia liubingyangii]
MLANLAFFALPLENTIPDPGYPTFFFFERGEWYDYVSLILVTALLAAGAWIIQRSKLAVLIGFIIVPVLLTIFWWPYSTPGTNSAGWFPIVKQYSALIGSLSLVAMQYFPKLRHKYWYLCLPPIILAVNIAEAVVRDFQCYNIHGVDPSQGMATWGGSWNIMNGIAGILNLLMISGWVGIYVARNKSKAIIWPDLTIWWIIAYDLWNFAYVYNCLADRAWYSGVALLCACTIPVLFPFARGSWIQYRAYTLTLWSGVVLTFPHFMQDSAFAHRSAHNPTALFWVSFVALVFNLGVFIYHAWKIATTHRNPATTEVYADTRASRELVERTAPAEVQSEVAARLASTGNLPARRAGRPKRNLE